MTDNNNNPIRLVGAGAIGSALGVFLNPNFAVGFCRKDGPVEHRVRLLWQDQWQHIEFPKLPEPTTPAIYLFAVKAFDLEQALLEHLADAPQGSVAISLVNGYVEPILKRLQGLFPDIHLRLGYCNFGVSSQADGSLIFRSKGAGRMFFGPVGRAPERTDLEKILAANDMCEWNGEILSAARTKWLFNTVLNSFCAAHKLKSNGEALKSKVALKALFEEGWELGKELFGGLSGSQAELFMGLLSLIGDTADNENSMARDVRLGRRTESDYLAGLALGYGERFPGLALLHRKVTTS